MTRTNPSSSSRGSDFEEKALASEPYLYLTTRGRKSGLPREIEIWFTHRDGRFYVIAEYSTSHWVRNLLADPRVQVRVAGKRFHACARILSPQVEFVLVSAIQDLSRVKYGWGEGTVVELTVESWATA